MAQEDFRPMKDVNVFKIQLEERTKSVNSILATFQQEKFMSILSQQLIAEGSLQFKVPDKVKWTYVNPYKYAIILNGKEIIIDDDGNVNAFSVGSSKMFSEMNQLIVNSVQGNVLDETKFHIEYFENDTFNMSHLKPKDSKQMGTLISDVYVYFDKNDFSVSKIKLVEPEGDYTLISFSDKQFNKAISDDVFSKK